MRIPYRKLNFWIILFLFLLIVFKVNTKSIPIYYPVNATITGLKKTTSSFFNSIKFFFVNYIDLMNIKEENKQLSEKNKMLSIQNSLLSVYQTELDSLKDALNFKNSYLKLNLIPVKNIINNFSTMNNMLIAENISNEILKKDQGIITQKGVIGIIDSVRGNKIKIIPITSSHISIPVWVGEDKIFAFATGTGNNKNLKLKLKYVESGKNIKPGDQITTNGYDSIFPEGIYVGNVVKVREIKNNIFINIDVHLPNKLYNNKYFFVIKR